MKFFKILFLITAVLPAAAQEFRLGKVTKAELTEKAHPADSSASAAILYKTGKSYFEVIGERWFLVTHVQSRIKIYKKDGYKYANQEVPYYTGGMTLKVYFDDAYTYNLVGDKIEKTKLRSDGEFEEKINDNVSVKKIVMPNVKEGSVIEYCYTIKTPYFHKFQDWYFQYEIPANYISYDVSIPSCFNFSRYLAGYIPVESSKPLERDGISHALKETLVTTTARNVKALKEESYVNNIKNYTSILKHELATVFSPNSPPEHYTLNWESVAKKIFEDKDFGRQLNATSYFEDDIKLLLAGALTDDEKMVRIFNYVKNRMNWNEEYGYYTDKGVSKAYKDKTGNVAEINLMLTAMLRYANINANPVLVSTRSNGVALFPNMAAYNYVVAAVRKGDTYTLLDATSKYSLPNIMPVRTLNWVGRMIKENGGNIEIDLMPQVNSKEVINLSVAIDNEGKVSGKGRDQYFDYNALIFRENYVGINKDSYIEKLESHYKGLEIADYNVTNDKELLKPVIEEFTFQHNGLADVIGDKIYFSPMLYYTQTVNPFKEEKREYPIDFTYQHQDKYMVSITIPDGYVVESLPQPINLSMEQNIGSFRYNIVSSNKLIQLNVTYDINYANVSSVYYETIRNFFRQMVEKQTEKVVLKKV